MKPTKHIAPHHNEWLRALDFYEQELHILGERLTEIAGDNTGNEVGKQVEHFQNQLIIHKDCIESLKKRIRQSLEQLGADMTRLAGHAQERTASGYDQVHAAYQTEEKLVNELRHEFNRFAAEWM